MTIEIVDFPINHGDFPYSYVAVYQGVIIKKCGITGILWDMNRI